MRAPFSGGPFRALKLRPRSISALSVCGICNTSAGVDGSLLCMLVASQFFSDYVIGMQLN